MRIAASLPVKCGPVAGLSLAMLIPSLDTSIVNTALPTLAHGFGASFQAVQWIVLAYLLTLTSLVVAGGYLGDRLGRRPVLLFGVGLFTIASLLCGIAVSLPMLVVARIVQGAGAAMMIGLTLASAGDAVPGGRLAAVVGWLGSMSAIGTALGPSLGGLLLAGLGWRMLFLINLPLGLLTLLLLSRALPTRPKPTAANQKPFDIAGMALLALALLAYALAMTSGFHAFGWLSVAGLALIGLWRVEQRAAAPLIHMAMLGDRVLRAGLGMSALVSTVVMATLIVGPFYLTQALGLGPMQAGLALSAGPLIAASAAAPAGRLAGRIGADRMVVAGLAAMIAGTLSLVLLPMAWGIAAYLGAIATLTAGYASFQTANNSLLLADARPARRGVVSGLLSLSRNLGLISGASLMGALFFAGAGTADIGAATPAQVAQGMRAAFLLASVLVALALVLAGAGYRRSSGSTPATVVRCMTRPDV